MQVAIATYGGRSRGSSLIGNAVPAARLTGQNVRGLSHLKLEKVVQFMKERRLLVTCLMETWRVTPQGFVLEELGGFLIIHRKNTCRTPPSSYRIAQRTRAHFYPQHWLLCHLGSY